MRSEKLYSGIVLVLIGIAFLLNNFGYIDFHWSNLFRLWPVFLVIAGVNMLLSGYREAWATILRIVVLIAGLGFIVFSNPHNHDSSPLVFNFNNDRDNNDDDSDNDGNKADVKKNVVYVQPYTAEAKQVRLNINGGATLYTLSDTTTDLFKADANEYYGHYNLSQDKDDSVQVLNFDMRNHNNRFKWSSDMTNTADLKLNTAPVWDINVKGGAAKLNFDLTRFKVKSVILSGGAASYSVKLGTKVPVTNVNVSAGVSEIEISVPKEAACDIVTSSGLSSSSFDGFSKSGDNHYTVGNFGTAANKIYIHLKGGLAEFKVKRY
jgi:uncharacterized membrane protein